jgi:16S rRNA (guanine527-N7)-methyltransferase
LLGPGPVRPHLEHTDGFAEAIGANRAGLHIDLGSGGGLPGLVLAVAWPATQWLLVDANRRSCDFLSAATNALGLADRVKVVQARAEELGRDPDLRGTARIVTARGFGRPAVIAECAAPFLVSGGRLVVSEPPTDAGGRWPEQGLALFGLRMERVLRSASGHNFVVIEQVRLAPERFPRRTGQPKRRPLF